VIRLAQSSITESEEYKFVTFQITLSNRFGTVIASDQREVLIERFAAKGLVNKLRVSCNGKIAWACSGAKPALIAAQRLDNAIKGKTLSGSELRDTMDTCASEAFLENSETAGIANFIVAAHADESAFYASQLGKTTLTTIRSQKFVSGDTRNAAQFITDTYYDLELSLKELVLLASYTVLMAHEHNPTYVEGLDIAACKRGGTFREFSEAEKEKMIKTCRSLSDTWLLRLKELSVDVSE
jgi:hypothetical protein